MPIIKQFYFLHWLLVIRSTRRFLIFCLFILIVCCLLSGWQLYRYYDKQYLIKIYSQRMKELPKPFPFLVDDFHHFQFQQVVVEGEYWNSQSMLIQNRMYRGQVGFEVLTPFRVKNSDVWLLVDRGWIKRENIAILSSLGAISGKQQVMGYIKLLDEYQFTLGENILHPKIKPWILQKVDINQLTKMTGQKYYPFLLRLDPGEPYGFIRDWVISAVPSERHLVYAVQWLLLALIVLVGYLSYCIERVKLV